MSFTSQTVLDCAAWFALSGYCFAFDMHAGRIYILRLRKV
jgi:hypothetical protein